MKWVWAVVALGVSARAMAGPLRSTGCAPSAEAAVARWIAGAAKPLSTEGYRVTAVHEDRVRQQRWAMVASCGQPLLPLQAVMMPRGMAFAMDAAAASPVVHAGESVTVTGNGADSSMALAGQVVEAGAVGQRVHVRLALKFDGAESRLIEARVVRTGVVEVVR